MNDKEKKNKKYYLGIDVGSISVNFAVIDEDENVIETLYVRTNGEPLETVKRNISNFNKYNIVGVGVTGSGRYYIASVIKADVVYDEITAHSIATLKFYPHAKTIIEIGGQDSKLIILDNGIVKDFNMNSVCAAGTGSFLDQQAARLKIKIEDFGDIALTSKKPTRIAGRCTVFAESDMIHKQQSGVPKEDVLAGLCESLALNYLSTVGKGFILKEPIIFQGGVAANKGMVTAFNKILKTKVIVPKDYGCMGAIGVAMLALEKNKNKNEIKKFDVLEKEIKKRTRICEDCTNRCELVEISLEDNVLATLGSKCGKYN